MTVTSVANGTAGEPGFIPAGVTVVVPIQGPGPVGIKLEDPTQPYDPVTNPRRCNTTAGGNVGGRIIRITPQGVMTTFAQGFNTSGAQDASSFIDSELSITFSADGTTLYALGRTRHLAVQDDGQPGRLDERHADRPERPPDPGRPLRRPEQRRGGRRHRRRCQLRAVPRPCLAGHEHLSPAAWATRTSRRPAGDDDRRHRGGRRHGGNGGTGGTTTGQVLANTFDGHGTPVAGVVAQFVPQATIEPVDDLLSVRPASSLTSTADRWHRRGAGRRSRRNDQFSLRSDIQRPDHAARRSTRASSTSPSTRSSGDPVRPGQAGPRHRLDVRLRHAPDLRERGRGLQELSPDRDRAEEPDAPAPQGGDRADRRGRPVRRSARAGRTGGRHHWRRCRRRGGGGTGGTGGTAPASWGGFNNADNTSLGDVNGMSLPAVLNEVISVTGTYPFPFSTSASTTPNDPAIGVIPNPLGPVLVFGNALTIGGTASTGTGGTAATDRRHGRHRWWRRRRDGANVSANVAAFTAADFNQYNDRILAAANRSVDHRLRGTCDRRPDVPPHLLGHDDHDRDDHDHQRGGRPQRSPDLHPGRDLDVLGHRDRRLLDGRLGPELLDQPEPGNGVTSDAYLTTPVGVKTLNFGPHAFKDLSAYNNPDGINGILAYTAVPAADVNDGDSLSTPPLVGTTDGQHHFTGTTSPPSYARVSIGNAIASIEGTIAIQYLLSHNVFPIIDTNSDGIITAQEIQNFTDTAATKGLAEAGAMARLLGGTSTYAQPESGLNNSSSTRTPISRRTPAPVQLLRLPRQRSAQGRHHHQLVPDAGQYAAAAADFLRDRRPPAGLGQRLPGRSDGRCATS